MSDNSITERDLLLAAISASACEYVQPDEVTVRMLIERGMTRNKANTRIAEMLAAGELEVREAIDPETLKRCKAYRRKTSTAALRD